MINFSWTGLLENICWISTAADYCILSEYNSIAGRNPLSTSLVWMWEFEVWPALFAPKRTSTMSGNKKQNNAQTYALSIVWLKKSAGPIFTLVVMRWQPTHLHFITQWCQYTYCNGANSFRLWLSVADRSEQLRDENHIYNVLYVISKEWNYTSPKQCIVSRLLCNMNEGCTLPPAHMLSLVGCAEWQTTVIWSGNYQGENWTVSQQGKWRLCRNPTPYGFQLFSI